MVKTPHQGQSRRHTKARKKLNKIKHGGVNKNGWTYRQGVAEHLRESLNATEGMTEKRYTKTHSRNKKLAEHAEHVAHEKRDEFIETTKKPIRRLSKTTDRIVRRQTKIDLINRAIDARKALKNK
jgi:hypothetical protein